MKLGRRLVLAIVAVVSVANVERAVGTAQRGEAGEIVEECDERAQFFDRLEMRCRNCSEVLRVFELVPGQDWQPSARSRSEEASQAPEPPRDFRSRADLLSSVIGARLTPLPPTSTNLRQPVRRPSGPLGESHNAADAILSRLVLSPQPSPHEALGAAADDDRYQSDSSASIDANPSANNPQLDESEDAGAPVEEQTNLTRLARFWQKLLWSFLQSGEISEARLLDSVEQCRSIQNLTACQMWANMCVMTMYSHSETPFNGRFQSRQAPSRRVTPTTSFARNAESRPTGASEPKTSWQQCAKFGPETICNSWREWRRTEKQRQSGELGDIFAYEDVETALPPRVGPAQSAPLKLNQQIQVVAYEYAFDGRLLGVSQFDLARFCPLSPGGPPQEEQHPDARPAKTGQGIRVGANMNLRCQFSELQANLFAPKHLNQTRFIDLFVGYQLNGAAFVKPVPVLVRTLLHQGQLANLKHAKDPTRWKFVHRFFPFATVKLGQTRDFRDDANSDAANQDREVFLFVRTAKLEIKLRRQQDKGLVIGSMLLVLDYDHLQLVRGRRSSGPGRAAASNVSGAKVCESRVQIGQQLVDMQAYQKDLDLFVTIICITSSIWSLIKCYNVQKYQGLIKLDFYSLGLFLVIACDMIANLLGAITIAFALFLFAAFKLQVGDQQQLLAPADDLEQNLLLKFKLALALKLVGFLYKLTVRLKADTFFIDWERPKMLTSAQIISQQRSGNGGAQATKQRHADSDTYPAAGFMQQHQTSFWRPYTIINRWLQMQTLRRQNLTLQLIAFVSIIELLKLDRLATSDPSLTWSYREEETTVGQYELRPNQCPVFRALILAVVYVALAVAQVLYRKYVHEPMIKCPVREFVDLCSVGNVSLFSMLHPRYGFYIHGRSANGSADCGLVEMNVLLEREERDLCSRRGLLPNSDQQTFVVVLPKIINDHYRKLLFRVDHAQLNRLTSPTPPNGNNSVQKRQQQPTEFIRSALHLPDSLSHQGRSRSFSSIRAFIESVVARNKAINAFLMNFLEHAYKDIDYAVRRRRRFESLIMEIDLSDEDESVTQAKLPRSARGGASSALSGDLSTTAMSAISRTGAGSQNFEGVNQPTATFFVDSNNSFATLIWLGLEWDLIALELFLMLNIDLCLGSERLILTVSLIWLINKSFQSIYSISARKNLITKAMLDEKFLIRT